MAVNTDGSDGLSTAEVTAAPSVLAALDKNKDERISADELPMTPGRGGPGGGRGDGEGRGGRQGRGGPGGSAEPAGAGASADELTATLMAFDTNKDGKLTRAEVPERLQGLFDRADANKDGVLTEAELKQAASEQAPVPGVGGDERDGRGGRGGRGGPGGGPGGRGPGGADPLMSALDVDGDGSLSIAETRNASAVLRRFDRDGDGILTTEEIFGGNFGRGGFGRG